MKILKKKPNNIINLISLILILFFNTTQAQIAYYPFNNNANDELRGTNGIINGSLLSVPNRFTNDSAAYYFDGDSSYIEIPFPDSLNFTGNFSINLWIDSIDTTGTFPYGILAKIDDIGQGPFGYYINITESLGTYYIKAFAKENGASYGITQSYYPLPIDQPTMVSIVKTSDSLQIWINGMLNASDENTDTNLSTSIDLFIGSGYDGFNNNDYFKGILDDITFFDHAIDSSTIDSLFSITGVGNFSVYDTLGGISCYGDSTGFITIDSITGGTPPYTYLWSDSSTFSFINNIPAGTYYLTITDFNNNVDIDTIILTEPAPLYFTSINTPPTLYNFDGTITLNVSGGTPPYSYYWENNGNTTNILTNAGFVNNPVTISDTNGCSLNAVVTISSNLINIEGDTLCIDTTDANNGIIWGDTSISVGVIDTLYGDINTDSIVSVLGQGGGYAAYVCDTLTSLGITDWYLPAINELKDISIYKDSIGGFSSDNYWSSTETDTSHALYCNFTLGNVDTNLKNTPLIVRCISRYEHTTQQQGPCLVASYLFNGNANDITGNGHDGDTTGHSPIIVYDRFGDTNSAYNFDTSQYIISIDNSFTYDCNNDASISLWFKYDSLLNDTNILMFMFNHDTSGDDVTSFGLALLKGGDTLIVAHDTATNSPEIKKIPYNFISDNWYHLAVARNSMFNEYEVYVNGLEISNEPISAPVFPTTNNYQAFTINAGVGNMAFNGEIDDINIYQCPIDPWIVDSLYRVNGWPYNPCDSFSVNLNIYDASCGNNDGYAVATVTGGSMIYDYLWSNGSTSDTATGLQAGTYMFQVTDTILGCSHSEYFDISNSSAATINETHQNVNCNGNNTGSIDITISGGVAPYNIAWSSGLTTEDISGLYAGNYVVTVTDAGGCVSTKSITINEPQPLTVNFSTTESDCGASTGTAQAFVSGGTPTYTYSWGSGHDTILGIPAGNYNLTVTDANGCQITGTALVSNTGAPVITLDSLKEATCGGNDGGIYISVTDGLTGIYNYSWSNGSSSQDIENITAGTYTIIVDDNGCIAAQSFVVANPPLERPEICIVTVDSATGANLVVWNEEPSSIIAGYNIYRETNVPNQFIKVGYQDYNNLSYFTDSLAFTWIKSYTYKISSVDNCGNESPLSDKHKTIHVKMNFYQGTLAHLIWDDYEGCLYNSFFVNKYTIANGWEYLDSLPRIVHTYNTMIQQSAGTLFSIAIKKDGPACMATKASGSGGPYTQSVSNIEDNGIYVKTSKSAIEKNITIFPNPAKNMVTIIAGDNNMEQISIVDITGKIIITKKTKQEQISIDVSNLSKGIYLIKIKTTIGLAVNKLIIE